MKIPVLLFVEIDNWFWNSCRNGKDLEDTNNFEDGKQNLKTKTIWVYGNRPINIRTINFKQKYKILIREQ